MCMQISANGIALIKKYEGFSAKVYLCPAGKPTIGYGHVVGVSEKFPPAGISEVEAEELLLQDAKIAENTINTICKTSLTQNQFDALASFIFNVGVGNFAKSKLLKFLNNGEFANAVNEFPKWIFAGGKQLSGLKTRRDAERELFQST